MPASHQRFGRELGARRHDAHDERVRVGGVGDARHRQQQLAVHGLLVDLALLGRQRALRVLRVSGALSLIHI